MNEQINYLVSILVPIYGVEQYIERCAMSLFEQTYEHIEYIFVDDCTPDNSIEVLNGVLERYPRRNCQVKIIRHKHNRGLAAARNTAVAAATGSFLIHVDSDDWVERNIVELCVKKQKEKNADIIVYGFKQHFSQAKYINNIVCSSDKESFIVDALEGKAPSIWNKMIRKTLYWDNGVKCLDGVNMGEDVQVTPLLYYYSHIIDTINIGLYHYNMCNANSYSNSFSSVKAEQTWDTLVYLTNFFSNKEYTYIHAISVGRLNFISRSLINSAHTHNRQYFSLLRKRLGNEKKEYYKEISFAYRLAFYIGDFYLLYLYSTIMKKLKHIFDYLHRD